MAYLSVITKQAVKKAVELAPVGVEADGESADSEGTGVYHGLLGFHGWEEDEA